MSRDLSKKLCEIAGIKPKCINCGQTVSAENPCAVPCNRQRYPDFGKPENFVRLFQIMYSQGNIGGNLGEGGYYLTNTIISEDADSCTPENYINTLCYILCDESHNIALYDGEIDDIKEAICEAEWVYE